MSDLTVNLWLMLALAVSAVAFLYSSVGHGGATGYLAVLALIGVSPDSARLRVFLSLSLASVPCAWLGSRVALPPLSKRKNPARDSKDANRSQRSALNPTRHGSSGAGT